MKKMILNFYFSLRLVFLYLLKVIFCIPRSKPKKISRILLIRLDRLGDFVLCLPVIDNLKLAYPQAQLDVLVRPYLADFANANMHINNEIIYENFFNALAQVKERQYDLVIDMLYDYTLLSALLAFLSSAPTRVGFSGGFREVLFSRYVRVSKVNKKDMVELNLELLRAIGIPIKVSEPQIKTDSPRLPPENIIVLHPGAHFSSQAWQEDKFIRLGKKIIQRYKSGLAVIGTSDEGELVSRIVSGIGDAHVREAFPDSHELIALLSKSRLFIGNNSGPLHVAVALGVPTISLMGPTDPVLWRPRGKNNIVIRKDLPCSPCSKASCVTHECMKSITVEEVMRSVEQLQGRF